MMWQLSVSRPKASVVVALLIAVGAVGLLLAIGGGPIMIGQFVIENVYAVGVGSALTLAALFLLHGAIFRLVKGGVGLSLSDDGLVYRPASWFSQEIEWSEVTEVTMLDVPRTVMVHRAAGRPIPIAGHILEIPNAWRSDWHRRVADLIREAAEVKGLSVRRTPTAGPAFG